MHLHNIHRSVSDCDGWMDCSTMEHWFADNGCCLATCPKFAGGPTSVYKVTISGERAESLMFTSDYFPFILTEERISPIVFYVRLTDHDAISLAQEKDISCVRAKADWSI